jgi:hypothetical protein
VSAIEATATAPRRAGHAHDRPVLVPEEELRSVFASDGNHGEFNPGGTVSSTGFWRLLLGAAAKSRPPLSSPLRATGWLAQSGQIEGKVLRGFQGVGVIVAEEVAAALQRVPVQVTGRLRLA